MKPIIALAAATMAAGQLKAQVPVVDVYEPTNPSGFHQGTMTIKGVTEPVILHVFGKDEVERSMEWGRRQAPIYYKEVEFEKMAEVPAMERYAGNRYFAKIFAQCAKQGYLNEMHRMGALKD